MARKWQGFDKKYLRPVLTRQEDGDDWGVHSCDAVCGTIKQYCIGGTERDLGRVGEMTELENDDQDYSDTDSNASSELVDFDDDDGDDDDWGGDISSGRTSRA